MLRRPPVAVTFDFWDTLVRAPTAAETRHARRDRLRAVLQGAGVEIDEAELDTALATVRREFDRHWAANQQFSGIEATDMLLRDLRADLSGQARREAADAFMGVGADHLPELTDNVAGVLRALQDQGVRIGIICDVGLSPSPVLRSYLDRHGVLEVFDHWSFSDEVGVYKPDPRIFDHALTGLGGIAAGASAHVGDLRRTDIAGARAFGMFAVRYAGSNDDRLPEGPPPGEGDASMAISAADAPEGDVVIHDHAELLGVLGFT